ncbi:putative peptide zinc metalloprotease protein [Desulfofustis glycolicus DSM 9705]|uniref:Putative peptide zinc metalloprotease protein n=1 Tax=Desulfofustis glycolicus DSM 9705 TaxID=1121409 RepID=A0A1M5YEH5_9BACT|nr:putative peptide zinc metalloprotease protein [Desulfofustis glycolicus DSM 9705]
MVPTAPASLPPLRQDLQLHAGPPDTGGAPSWVLHDPVAHRFFEISWPAFEILSRWSMRESKAIVADVCTRTTLHIGTEDIEELWRFLEQNFLLDQHGPEHTARLQRAGSMHRMGKLSWVLKHYLFFRVPLFRPTSLLNWLSPRMTWCFHPMFWKLLVFLGLAALVGVSFQWDAFVGTFVAYAGWTSVLGIVVSLGFAKVAHEMGHALAAHRHGCRVPQMGVAFMVMMPVLYTDTTDAWKLPSRKARMQIAAAGMATELMLAVVATWAWMWLPDGPARAGAFMLATTTWVLTLVVNLSPFMRFDGYYLLSDAAGISNLHERAFALGRWKLRRVLLGWSDPAPEELSRRATGLLIVFAYLTWIYRLVLFLGIAFLVYHLFFKALGLLLLAVELSWFVVMPVSRELSLWWQGRSNHRWTGASILSTAGLLLGVLALCVPWPRGVQAPAVLSAEQSQWLFAPMAAQIKQLDTRHGHSVSQGQTVIGLTSPDLEQRLAAASVRERSMQWKLAQQPLNADLLGLGPALREQWAAAKAELTGQMALRDQLEVRSGISGRVTRVAPGLQPGVWVRQGEPLVQVVADGPTRIDAYVVNEDMPQIQVGDTARFVPEDWRFSAVNCQVGSLDRVALPHLEHAFLGSPHGGPLPASVDAQGLTVPLHAVFRVRLDRCDGEAAAVLQEKPGVVVIGSSSRSVVGDWIGNAVDLWNRESGL